MTTTQRTASLHERSVQAIARGELDRTRRGRGPDRRPRTRLRSERLHDLLSEYLVGVDPARVDILSPTQVVIWNGPRSAHRPQ